MANSSSGEPAAAGEQWPWRAVDDGVVVIVRLTPRGGADRVDGLDAHGGQAVLKVRVRAVPEDGEANAALCGLIAHWLDVPGRSVRLAQGTKARLKTVHIAGDAATLTSRLAAKAHTLAG